MPADEENKLKVEADVLARKMQGMPPSIALDRMLAREAEIYQKLDALALEHNDHRHNGARGGRPGIVTWIVLAVVLVGFVSTSRILVFVGALLFAITAVTRRAFRRSGQDRNRHDHA